MPPRRFASIAAALESRGNAFNALRLLLAILVIFSHCYPVSGLEPMEPLARLTAGRQTIGLTAVHCFFVISGFLITRSWLTKPAALSFLLRRAARLAPGYWASALVFFGLFGWLGHGNYARTFTAERIPLHIVDITLLLGYRMSGVFPGLPWAGVANGSLWTIPYEATMYLVTLGLGLATLLRRRQVVLLLMAACLIGSGMIEQRMHQHPEGWTRWSVVGAAFLRFATYYLAGATCYVYASRLPCSLLAGLLGIGVAVVSVIITQSFYLISLPLAYGLICVCLSLPARVNAIGSRNDISYGVYLYGWPVQQTTLFLAPQLIHAPLLLFVASLPTAIFLGTLSWFLVEQPMLRWGRRKSKSPTVTHPIETPPEPTATSGAAAVQNPA